MPIANTFNRFDDLDREGSPLSASACDGIWLLDDDVSMLKALGRLMNSAGFIVEKFNHPAAFLARLEHAPCRVAILDVWMPDMNGLEVQGRLRRDSPQTRIIFISGRDDPPVRQTALDAGALAFLAKPFDDEFMVQLVRKAAASKHSTFIPKTR
jgi:FixJ family two-component response regulator